MTRRLDDLQIGGLQMIQDTDLFCFGMDAVLLSGFVSARAGEQVLDIGTGTGILPLLLSAKTDCARITGIEIQEEAAALAEENVRLNHLEERITIIRGDVRQMTAPAGRPHFQVIVTNPPYIKCGSGIFKKDAKGIARHEASLALSELMKASARLLADKGRFYMVHRPARLADIFTEMRRAGIEPKKLRAVHPYAGREAQLVLIEGIRSGGPQMTVLPPLIIYDENGRYTAEADRIYGICHEGGEDRNGSADHKKREK